MCKCPTLFECNAGGGTCIGALGVIVCDGTCRISSLGYFVFIGIPLIVILSGYFARRYQTSQQAQQQYHGEEVVYDDAPPPAQHAFQNPIRGQDTSQQWRMGGWA